MIEKKAPGFAGGFFYIQYMQLGLYVFPQSYLCKFI